MTGTMELLKIDQADMAKSLEEARSKLGDGEITLDLSAVRRIDPNALRALEDFAVAAGEKSTKVALYGVNVGVYKVLKLARLASRFSAVN